MTVNKIDCDNRQATLTLSAKEMIFLRQLLCKYRNDAAEKLEDEKRYFIKEFRAVENILHDGNLVNFFSHEEYLSKEE